MGWRFRKRIKIAPGVRVNLGKRGASVSAGIPGSGLWWTSGHSSQGGGAGGCCSLIFFGVLGFALLASIFGPEAASGLCILGLIVLRISQARAAWSPPEPERTRIQFVEKNGLPYCPQCGQRVSLKRTWCRACGADLRVDSQPIRIIEEPEPALPEPNRPEPYLRPTLSQHLGAAAGGFRDLWDVLGPVGQPIVIGLAIASPIVVGVLVLISLRS